MTTERQQAQRQSLRLAPVIALALVAWIALLAVFAPWVAAASGPVIAIAPKKKAFAALAASDAAFVRETLAGLVLQPESDQTVRQLYAAGAWLVLPARRGGCLGLSTRARPI